MPLVKKPAQPTQKRIVRDSASRPPWAEYTRQSHPHLYEIEPASGMPFWMIRDASKHPVPEAEVSEPE